MRSILALIGITVVYSVYRYVSGLRHNIAEAKRSGLPYIVARRYALAAAPDTKYLPGANMVCVHSLLAHIATMAIDAQAMGSNH